MQQIASFDHNDFNSSNQREADKALLVKFFLKPRENKTKSAIEGRPIFEDVEHVDIKIPGNKGEGACRPATEEDKRRFPDHYKLFKNRITEDVATLGTPLSEWSAIPRSMVEELAFHEVKTVEQLANMADSNVSKFMGLFQWKAKAKTWLENAEKEKPLWEMDQKVKAQSAQIDELKSVVATLVEQLEGSEDDEELTENQKRTKKRRALKAAKEKV